MSTILKQIFSNCRPPTEPGRGDKYITDHALEVRRILAKHFFADLAPAAKLMEHTLCNISLCVVELAEDIHNDIGLWHTIESSNQRLYGTPLPFVLSPGDKTPHGFDARRIQYLLYMLIRHIVFLGPLAPRSPALADVSRKISTYLNAHFTRMPKDSSVKKFLGSPTDHPSLIKHRLFWLGGCSYLLRLGYTALLGYMKSEDPDGRILDRYCHMARTGWNGMLVLDILADVLHMDGAVRTELLDWSNVCPCTGIEIKPLASEGNDGQLTLHNILNDHPVTALVPKGYQPPPEGSLIGGVTYSWRKQPYWDDLRLVNSLRLPTDTEIDTFRKSQLTKLGSRVFLLHPSLKETVQKRMLEYHRSFTAQNDGDVKVVPTGKEAATIWLEQQIFLSPGVREFNPEELYRLLPPEVLEAQDGVGIFSEADHGLSLIPHYHPLLEALRKTDIPLDHETSNLICGMMLNIRISPSFLRKMAQQHGIRPWIASFTLESEPESLAFEWLLASYKAQYGNPSYIPNLCVLPETP